MAKRLTQRQALFVAAYLSNGCKSSKEAAIAAGFSPAGAGTRASELLNNELVKAAIEAEQEKLRAAAGYSAEKAMEELDEAMAMARTNKDPHALAKAVDLRMKLMGLIGAKDKGSAQNFQLVINGIDTYVKEVGSDV